MDAENPEMTKNQGKFGQALDHALLMFGGKKLANTYHVALDVMQGKFVPDLVHDVAQHVSRTALQAMLEYSEYNQLRYEHCEVIDFAKKEAQKYKDVPGIKEIDDIIAFEKNRAIENEKIELEKLKKTKIEKWKEAFKIDEPVELKFNAELASKESNMEKILS